MPVTPELKKQIESILESQGVKDGGTAGVPPEETVKVKSPFTKGQFVIVALLCLICASALESPDPGKVVAP